MSLTDFLSLTPKGNIGGIEIQATLEEIHVDSLQVTDHPVELGAPITDHAFNRPSEVVIRAGWSNSSLKALLGAATSLFKSGDLSGADYVGAVYSQLLALKESRKLFDITTSRRQYRNMVMVSLAVTTDQQTGSILMATATCRQVIVVKTDTTSLPARENQGDPASTAETENAGAKQVKPGSPSPGGSVPPSKM